MTAPTERGAEIGRRIGVGLMYGLWKPRVLGSWKVPATGPVILAVNHSHNIDGPMVIGVAPRASHFLVKKEAFVGPLGPFMRAVGQLEVPLPHRLYVRLELAGLVYFVRTTDDGAQTHTTTAATYRTGLGVGMYF